MCIWVFIFRNICQNVFQHLLNASTMAGSHLQWLAHTQFKELNQSGFGMYAIYFVRHQEYFFAQSTQFTRNLLIRCQQACTCIDHKNDHIGFMDGCFRLFSHVRVDATFTFANTASIDHNERFILIGCITIFAVTCQTCKVGNKCITALGNLVKQR